MKALKRVLRMIRAKHQGAVTGYRGHILPANILTGLYGHCGALVFSLFEVTERLVRFYDPVFALTPSRGDCALETGLQKVSSLSQKILSLYPRDCALKTGLDIWCVSRFLVVRY